MADEEQGTEDPEDTGAHEPENDSQPEVRGADADEGSEEGVGDEGGEVENADGQTDERKALSRRTVNHVVVGNLTFHYAARDVTLMLDGDAAMRVLTMFWRQRPGPHADRLDPETSSAVSAWLVFDLEEPLAVSWYPILGTRTRTAVDPVLQSA